MNLREWLNRHLIDAPFDWLNDHPDLSVVIVCIAVVGILFATMKGAP